MDAPAPSEETAPVAEAPPGPPPVEEDPGLPPARSRVGILLAGLGLAACLSAGEVSIRARADEARAAVEAAAGPVQVGGGLAPFGTVLWSGNAALVGSVEEWVALRTSTSMPAFRLLRRETTTIAVALRGGQVFQLNARPGRNWAWNLRGSSVASVLSTARPMTTAETFERLTAALLDSPGEIAQTVRTAAEEARARTGNPRVFFETGGLVEDLRVLALGATGLPQARRALLALRPAEVPPAFLACVVRALAQAPGPLAGMAPEVPPEDLVPRGAVLLGTPLDGQAMVDGLLRWYREAGRDDAQVREEIVWALAAHLADARVEGVVLDALRRPGSESRAALLLACREAKRARPASRRLAEAFRGLAGSPGGGEAALRTAILDAILREGSLPAEAAAAATSPEPAERVRLLGTVAGALGEWSLPAPGWAVDLAVAAARDGDPGARAAAVPALAWVLAAIGWDEGPVREALLALVADVALPEVARTDAARALAAAAAEGLPARFARRRVLALSVEPDVRSAILRAVLER